jgi:hypothetical protein
VRRSQRSAQLSWDNNQPVGSHDASERGQELEAVVLALGRWGSVAPFSPGDAEIGVDAFVIALKTLFDPDAAARAGGRYELRLGEQSFCAELVDGRLEVTRGTAEAPDAVIESDPGTLSAVLWHDRELAEAERSGAIAITGSRRQATRFLRLFPLPA